MVWSRIANIRTGKEISKLKNHLQDKDDIEMVGLKRSYWILKVNRNGILSIFDIICDLDLGVEKTFVRRIKYACNSCIE